MNKNEQNYNLFDWWKKVVFKNYANFEGRARRKEFWSFTLIYVLLFLPVYVFLLTAVMAENTVLLIISSILFAIVTLGMIIPNLAVSVRRLHDVNKSGWTLLLSFVPVLSLYLLYLNILEGTNGTNDYGKDPKQPLQEINEIGIVQE